MPFVDTSALEVVERRPGWFGRYFDSASMTFAHYEAIVVDYPVRPNA